MTEILMQLVKRKLEERHNQKYNPQPGDRVTNPYSEYKTVEEKRAAYNAAMERRERAYINFEEYIYLGNPGAEFNNVEFIAGIWRVQRAFPYEITNVRNKQFVLVNKLSYTERTHFDFYSAAHAMWGATGISADLKHPDWVVAKYDTDKEIYTAYGHDISSARAFLGIKLYDEYQDLIDSVVRPKDASNLQEIFAMDPVQTGDRIINPMATGTFGHVPLYRNVAEKRLAYDADVKKGNVYAINEANKRIMLGHPGAEFNDVDFIGGLWRIQNKFNQQITRVRDREFFIMKKLPRQEKTKFEFYAAELVGNNCYGYSLSGGPDFIVARYGKYSAYGQTIEQARAFLGIKLYDEFQDVIHAASHKLCK